MLKWNGLVFAWRKRIFFIGEAAKSRPHASHTLMIVIACGGKFSLKVGSKGRWESYDAAIIDAHTKHCMDGTEAEFVAVIHLLPETEEARELRRECLAKRSVYEVPAGPARKLSALLERKQNYLKISCTSAEEFCKEILSELIESPSTRLEREVDYHVRRAIEVLYARMDVRLKSGKSRKDYFTSQSVARALNLEKFGRTKEDLERAFRESTGASFNQYVKLLRFRATLVKLALNLAELREAPKQIKVDGKKKRKWMRMSLKAAAKWMGWGDSSNLTRACVEILGINPRSLKDESGFLSCRR